MVHAIALCFVLDVFIMAICLHPHSSCKEFHRTMQLSHMALVFLFDQSKGLMQRIPYYAFGVDDDIFLILNFTMRVAILWENRVPKNIANLFFQVDWNDWISINLDEKLQAKEGWSSIWATIGEIENCMWLTL